MTMVYCRGCGKEIHESAQMCPQCGALQFDQAGSVTENAGWGNPMAWIIAFAPLIGALAGEVVSAVFHYNGSWLVIVTIGINILLCEVDSKDLTKNGTDCSKLNKMLVPLYLFQRAKLLKEKLGYPILWCILFLVQLAGSP